MFQFTLDILPLWKHGPQNRLALQNIIVVVHAQPVRQEEVIEISEAGIANGLVEGDLGIGFGFGSGFGGLIVGRHGCGCFGCWKLLGLAELMSW